MAPNLGSDEVHTWSVRLDVPRDLFADLHATLSLDERNRGARLRFDRDRRRFVVAHGVLREVLGRYVGTRPDDLRFIHNEFGKPELNHEFDRRPKFNLSHSEDLALIAVAADAEVGVDVERVRAGSDFADIARSFFSADEVDELSGLPSRLYPEGFLKCWTRKEAYMKARGGGFSIPPESYCVRHLDGAWSVHTLRPAPGYIGALAVDGTGRRLRRHEWRASDAFVDAARKEWI